VALGRAGQNPDREIVLAVVHDLALSGGFVAGQPAELADDPAPAPLVEVDLLTGQRSAPAVAAAVALDFGLAARAAQQ
jgi:hypothetical protein